METNLEKLRQGHIHSKSHKHLERVRQTDSGLGWEQLLQRRNSKASPAPPRPPPANQLVASPSGNCDPEEAGDWGKGRGQSSSEGSPRSLPPVSVWPVQAQIRHSMNEEEKVIPQLCTH